MNTEFITEDMDGYDANKDGLIISQDISKGTLVSDINSITVKVIKVMEKEIINNNDISDNLTENETIIETENNNEAENNNNLEIDQNENVNNDNSATNNIIEENTITNDSVLDDIINVE